MTNEVRMDKEANAFARNLLMPEFMLRPRVDEFKYSNTSFEDIVTKMAKLFEVSEAQMAIRIRELYPNKF